MSRPVRLPRVHPVVPQLLAAGALLSATACGVTGAPPVSGAPDGNASPLASVSGAPTPASSTGASTASPTPVTSPAPTPSPTLSSQPASPRCTDLAGSLTLAQQVGQLMMVGISSGGLPASQARILSRGHVGSVVLLGNTTAGRRPVAALSKRVHGVGGRPRGVSVMLAVDQEGGQVQRLRGPGFERIPSARSQARLSDRALARRAERWGRQLRAAGIDADLAPVADVVPAKLERVNRPIGLLQRGYGPDPDVVATKVPAFVRGLHRAGVVSAVKHYPGLGRVRGNTDFETRVVDSSTTRHTHALAGFRAAVNSGVDLVMMSSAYYTKIDPGRRAVFSPLVIDQMLRGDAKFAGVVISDDLAARAVSDYGPGKRAVTFLRAGGDLVIAGDPRLAPAMIAAVKAEAGGDQQFRGELRRKAARVLQMKARRGLARCR